MRGLPSILLIAVTLLFGSGALRVVHQASHAVPHPDRQAAILAGSSRAVESFAAPRSTCGASCAFHRHAAPTQPVSRADHPSSQDSDCIAPAPMSPDAADAHGDPESPEAPSDGHCDHDCGLCLFLATAAAPLTAPSGSVGELLERAGRLSVLDTAVGVTIDLRIDSTRGPPRAVRSV